MKRFIQGGLFVLLTAVSLISPAQAETLKTGLSSIPSAVTQSKLTPFNLVGMAYQGFFVENEIPSSSGLMCAYQCGRVEARDIVKAAIRSHRLPESALSDESYIQCVDRHLQLLID